MDRPRHLVGWRPAAAAQWAYRTKREAQALVEVLGARRSGSYVEPTRQSVAAYLHQWFAGLENVGRRPTTLCNYRSKIELYIAPKLGEVALQDLRATDLGALYAYLLKRGGARTPAGLSLATVHQVHVILGKALHDAERKGLVVRNVARLASPPTLSAARGKHRRCRCGARKSCEVALGRRPIGWRRYGA